MHHCLSFSIDECMSLCCELMSVCGHWKLASLIVVWAYVHQWHPTLYIQALAFIHFHSVVHIPRLLVISPLTVTLFFFFCLGVQDGFVGLLYVNPMSFRHFLTVQSHVDFSFHSCVPHLFSCESLALISLSWLYQCDSKISSLDYIFSPLFD